MRELLDIIFWIVGMSVSVLVTTTFLTLLMSFIKVKIKDFKQRKTVIRKGAIFFVDGKRVELKRDLVLNFHKTKYTECECTSFDLPIGLCKGTQKYHRSNSETNFETELLQYFKKFPNKVESILEYMDK